MRKETEMAKAIRDYVLPILLTVATIISAWSIYANQVNSQREREQDKQIAVNKEQICTKADMEKLLGEQFKQHFAEFELYLQGKYKITPKK